MKEKEMDRKLTHLTVAMTVTALDYDLCGNPESST